RVRPVMAPAMASATNWSRRWPAARTSKRCAAAVFTAARSPDIRLDVALGLDEHIDERSVVDVLGEDLGHDAALEQLATLADLVVHDLEQVVVGDAVEDLRLVVEGQLGCDRTGQLPRALLGVDQRGHERRS